MLAEVTSSLACPVCAAALAAEPAGGPAAPSVRVLRCPSGHAYDVARQGHVSLLAGGHRHGGDDAAMVAHRLDFLGAGHYDPIAAALCAAATHVTAPGLLLDIGGGPGWYAAHVLDALPDRHGLTFDTSSAAARRAARAHPRLASVVADGWARYPLIDAAVAVALCVFAPRNPTEITRVLHPGGAVLSVLPAEDHLEQARDELGLLAVAPGKEERLAAQLSGLTPTDRVEVRRTMALSHADLTNLALMGPSAFHLDADALSGTIARLPETVDVTCAVSITTFRLSG